MPEIKSKKSGKVWKDAQSFYNDHLQADPELKQFTPEELWQSAQSDGNYELGQGQVDPQPQVPSQVNSASTQPPPSGPVGFVGKALWNLPGSFVRQAKQMGTGLVEAARLANPNALFDPGSFHSKAVFTGSPGKMHARPYDEILDYYAKGIADTGSAIKKDYQDFYTGGNFLRNVESDPARVAADVASLMPIVGWAAKAGGFSKVASMASKVGAAADMASSPVPYATRAVSAASAGANAVARSGMKWSLQLPKNSTKPGMRTALAEYALRNKLPMTAKGAKRADHLFEQEYGNMTQMESDATARGVLIEPSDIRSSANKEYSRGSIDSTQRSKFSDEVDGIMSDEDNFGLSGAPGQSFPVTPSRAGEIRKRLNRGTMPNKDAWQNQPEVANNPTKMLAAKSVNKGIKSELASKIPGHGKAANRAQMAKRASDQAHTIAGNSDAASSIEHTHPYVVGANINNAIHGNANAASFWGSAAKALHTPQTVSRGSVAIFNPDIMRLHRDMISARKPLPRTMFNASKQFGKPDESRPFKKEEKIVNDPSRPFQE